ncbi:MAG: S8 family serine peptidase [Planctomycetes bacterium]|nr:S8 family serine peptidase [Planctomycetota bacterium]
MNGLTARVRCRRIGPGLAIGGPFLLVAGILAAGTPSAFAEIRFRSGTHVVPASTPRQIEATVGAIAATGGARHLVVQFAGPLDAPRRKALEDAGLALHRYLGDHAYFASFSPQRVDAAAVGAMPWLKGLEGVRREWKLDPRVAAGVVPEWAVVGKDAAGVDSVAVYVVLHPDVPLADGVATARRHGAVVRDTMESINALVVELPLPNLDALADEDAVQWIEWPLPRMSEINNSNRVITQADIVQAPPYGLSGSGVTVLVYDANQARSTHADFQGRLVNGTGDASGIAAHATHVSCTIGGAGVANSLYKGMAPGVSLVSYGFEYDGTGIFLYSNPGDMETDYSTAISTYGADISNNSIGTNTEPNGFDCAIQGDYGVTSELIDTIVRGDGSNPLFNAPFRIVWANGNERQGSRCDVEGYGDYYSTAPPAGAKNHIAVGALNSNDDSMTTFSSWGPVDDGRMKPDVSAPGCEAGGDGGVTSCSSAGDTAYTTMCGTSMASPTVCGLSSLLLQDYRAQFPGNPDFRNSTLKILLAHTAAARGNAGPDYQLGYGSVRIQQSVDFMRTGNFLENQVSQGGTYSVLVLVNPGDPELKVTVAWDDYPATLNTGRALINDLDLRVFDPSSQQHYPWTLDQFNPSVAAVRTQANHVDNIEQVYVQNPAAGVWRVEVHGFDVPQGPQPFSLCASPALVACSSAGTITLNAAKYACSSSAAIQVNDCDLNTNSNVVETVNVTITSTSEPGGETVVLTETGAETADFRGTIPLSTGNAAGVLLIAHGDTVTASYVDADNGQGQQNVTVTDTAAVDCAPPVISAVQASGIGPFTATVTFTTDEPANGTVRFGLSCGALSGSAAEVGYRMSHSVALSGLQENTTYFYAVDAADEAGNAASNNNGGACYNFTTPDIPDYFTELFTSNNDLDFLSLAFQPDGSFDYYSGCAEPIAALPVDPSGGTTLTLSDDTFAAVTLSGGANVSLYGTAYGTFYVGSNGYVTFGSGDSTYLESLAAHFNRPRIAACFDDLNPGVGGTVSWKQLADRAVVTWLTVPEYGTTNTNTFQIEMRFDGTLVVSFLGVAVVDGLAGLSAGGGQPADFFASDLSGMGSCAAPTCSDGIQNQGEDRIDCGGPCPPCACTSDAACGDGLFCTGAEVCDAFGQCQPGGDPCPVQYCDEAGDRCVDCLNDGHCSDGLFCNGAEVCVDGACVPGSDPCPGLGCDEVNDVCTPCDNNGTCEINEDCDNCPSDCISVTGAVCGNGVCEAGDGEDCLSCAADCNGRQTGPTPKQFCCGDGAGRNPVTCADSRCTTAPFTCTSTPVVPYCCGDTLCEGAESTCNCAVDCGAPAAGEVPNSTCANGLDDDCDGAADCADGQCATDPACTCRPAGAACTTSSQCCSNNCKRGVCR